MATVILNPSADAHIESANATTNYVTADPFKVGESSASANNTRTLVKFDLTSIPGNATIESAVLAIYAVADFCTNARSLRVFRTKRTVVYDQVTYNVYSTGNSWAAAGGFDATDCEQTDIGNVSLTATETLNEYKSITLTASKIQEMLTGVFTNNGLLLKVDTENSDMYQYTSNEGANKPKLTITYSVPGGSQCIIV